MKKLDLCGAWTLESPYGGGTVQVPGDFYSDLYALGCLPEPYESDNTKVLPELDLCPAYTRTFTYTAEAGVRRAVLRFNGVDTLARIYLNGHLLGETNNMHCVWDYDVLGSLKEGENTVRVEFRDPRPMYAESYARRPLRGAADSLLGYQYLRKAHFMTGWDFAPEMINAGLFRPVELLLYEDVSLQAVTLRQQTDSAVARLFIKAQVCVNRDCAVEMEVTVTDPDGQMVGVLSETVSVHAGQTTMEQSARIRQPRLWWPNGMGDQPLYTVTTLLMVDGVEVDRDEKTIGFRSLEFSNAWDEYGREFTFCINGKKPFIKGANYVPEDCLMSRRNRQRTERLLRDCAAAHYNMIRVWGGGIYPDDWFFDLCDELGLMIWLDFMYACCFIDDDPVLIEATKKEVVQNLNRFSHRTCLALLCGNNEIEEAMDCWDTWCDVADQKTKQTYLKVFETEIPSLLKATETDVAYIPSSPTSGGSFQNPGCPDCMDVHDWKVWHHNAPYESYRNYYYRFLSEFGFESFPTLKTLECRIGTPEDMNVYSYEMEYRQRCPKGNKLIMQNMGEHFRMPGHFRDLIYLSQLMQADAVRYAIDHLRRNRGRCMGALYWQINDCWPGVSWSGIDYDGRWKALHYAAREFYAPQTVILTEDADKKNVTFSVSNEALEPFTGTVCWRLLKNDLTVLRSGRYPVSIDGLSAADLGTEGFGELTEDQRRECVLVAELLDEAGNRINDRMILFVPSKHFHYIDPRIEAALSCEEGVYYVTLRAQAFAHNVWLEFGHTDCVFSRNFFPITDGEPVTVRLDQVQGEPSLEDLRITCVNTTI